MKRTSIGRIYSQRSARGFTIVELLIVVVVIAILASITVVSYNGITSQARKTVLKSDLKNGATQLQLAQMEIGSFPAEGDEDLKNSEGTILNYTSSGSTFCLSATNSSLEGVSFYVTESGSVQEGDCPLAMAKSGDLMQEITDPTCPSEEKIMAVDARDNHTYWVQKLDDSKCWMLTNLAYAGGTSNGGSSANGDIRTIQDGTSDSTRNYNLPKYYVSSTANPTANPTEPSESTNGGATNPQYGYHYNWCAAMGGQLGTSACAGIATPLPDPDASICPGGWRLPTSGSGGEFELLSNAIGATNNTSGSTSLRTAWLAQMGGGGGINFFNQGSNGIYWSSSQTSTTNVHLLVFSSSTVNPSGSNAKNYGYSVRCLLG